MAELIKVLGAGITVVVIAASGWMLWSARRAEPGPEMPRAEKEIWRMPALALLERPTWSLPKRIAMLTMAGYIVLAVLFLAVKAVEIALLRH